MSNHKMLCLATLHKHLIIAKALWLIFIWFFLSEATTRQNQPWYPPNTERVAFSASDGYRNQLVTSNAYFDILGHNRYCWPAYYIMCETDYVVKNENEIKEQKKGT